MFSETTRSIKVTVLPSYLPGQSSPAERHFAWAYRIRIENLGKETVQLQSRHWRIMDAVGRVQEVKGPGVVGENPVLQPGESFEYQSGVPLDTPSGIMAGTYRMQNAAGEQFDVQIPAFSLDSPYQVRH